MSFTSSSTPRPSLPPPPGSPPTGPLPELPSAPTARDPSPTPKDMAQLYEQYSWPTLDVASLKEKLESVAGSSDEDATEACDEDGVYDGDVERGTEGNTQNWVLTSDNSSPLTQGLEVGTETQDQSQNWVLTPDPRFDLAQDLDGSTLPVNSSLDKATAKLSLNPQTDDLGEGLNGQTASKGEGVGGSLGVKQQSTSKNSDESDDEDYAQAYEIYQSSNRSVDLQGWACYAEGQEFGSGNENNEQKYFRKPSEYPELMPLLEWYSKLRLKTQDCFVIARIKLTNKGRIKQFHVHVSVFGKRDKSSPVCSMQSAFYRDREYPTELAPFFEWARGFETQMTARSIFTNGVVAKDGQVTDLKVEATEMRTKEGKVWLKEQSPVIKVQNPPKPSIPSVDPVQNLLRINPTVYPWDHKPSCPSNSTTNDQTEEANKVKKTSLLSPECPPTTESQTEESNKVKKTSRLLPT
ncbi:MAG: hypothetical protein Q9194_003557 [Teloschistes cf. exilis]